MFRSRSRATWGEFFFGVEEGGWVGEFSVEREKKPSCVLFFSCFS